MAPEDGLPSANFAGKRESSFRQNRLNFQFSAVGHRLRRPDKFIHFNELYGAPEEIRTPDPQIRSLVLYPAELRARGAGLRRFAVGIREAG
jgi:hypothetical protein